MKIYTVLVSMKNSDVIVWHGQADDAAHAQEIINKEYEDNGWSQDVAHIIVYLNRTRKHAGFSLLRQIVGARQGGQVA